MDQNNINVPQVPPQTKHIKSFWAIAIIFLIAALAGILIYWFQFQVNYDEEINSLEIRMQKRQQTVIPQSEVPAGEGQSTTTGTSN